jgi:hypothetical protein
VLLGVVVLGHRLLLEMYKPQLRICPLFQGLEENIITQLAMVMQAYLAIKGDIIVQENQVGEQMFMIVKGEVKLDSECAPKVRGKVWADGAFFGELPMLGLANGELRNQHVYTVEAVEESQLSVLNLQDMEDMERDYPVSVDKSPRCVAVYALSRHKSFALHQCCLVWLYLATGLQVASSAIGS